MLQEIPCMILRGGTSKGLYFLEKDLPPAGERSLYADAEYVR